MSGLDSPVLHAAVLAAGASTRFGSPKQLARLSGTTVLHQAIANASVVAGRSVGVVLGASAGEISRVLGQSAVSVVLNRGWQEGLASSIRAAVNSAPASCDGLLMLLADQVAVTAEDLKRLHAAWRRHPVLIAAALHGGVAGLPAIFPRWTFPDLLGLRGEADPRLVIRRNVDRAVRVPMPNAAIDLDTPEDLLGIAAAAAVRKGPRSDL